MKNNETSGKPVLMTYDMNPNGGTEVDSKKPGSGRAGGTNKYGLNSPETYYRVTGGPTLGDPAGGPDEPASSKTPKRMARTSAPNMASSNSGRNSAG